MTFLWYIIGSILIAAIVFLTSFFTIKRFIESEQKKQLLELKFNSKSTVTPLRIQAYERLALFLERIEPNQLLLRINTPGLTSEQLKTLLLAAIRGEYDHNLSQQIFVSSDVWNCIVQAKEETVKLVNLCAGKVDPDTDSIELATGILEQTIVKNPVSWPLERLKDEVRLLF